MFESIDVILAHSGGNGHDRLAALTTLVVSSLSLKQAAVGILTWKISGVPAGSKGMVKEITTKEVVINNHVQRVRGVMCTFEGVDVEVGPARYSVFDGQGCGVAFCEQLPLLLGWAITVHCAHGLPLDAVEIDFAVDTWSTFELDYTALSRVRSMSSLRVQGLRKNLIRVSRRAAHYYQKPLTEIGVDPTEDGRRSIAS